MWHKSKIVLLLVFLALTALGCGKPYSLKGNIRTVYGNIGIPDVTIAFDGFGTAKTLADGSWNKTEVSGRVNITPAKEGWFFFPESVQVRRSATINFLTTSNLGNRILFTKYDDTDYRNDIWVMDPDGLNRNQLTFSGNCAQPSWSPDRSKIAYVVYGDSWVDSQIWLMNLDGTDKTLIAAQEGFLFQEPSWSPDGARLLFYALGPNFPDDGCMGYLRIIDIYDSNLAGHDIPLSGLLPSAARWSPDGNWIAFSAPDQDTPTLTPPLKYDIYIMRPDGTGLTRITSKDPVTAQTDFAMTYIRWSPDGQKLVFSAGKDGMNFTPFQIYVINRDGSNLVKLTNLECNAYGPSWSPDGKKIAFSMCYSIYGDDPRGLSEIYIMNSDGTGMICLPNPISGLGQSEAEVCWSAF
ncbi:MAG TPA: hypothetical protein DHD79_09765 [Firmicutes bacterium]|jgi:dipeptidyl aminopeptidase/acylaminoacyl peptidase|nr:hypothetical protein [Bacillota bacterium]HBG44333.1 hypothetical protein [Bacillota bacterium]HCF89058.1 hypothetical protein [Bacillota bacterium]HCX71511.1 hypothetical protein [Bacillota bacterium]